MPTELSPLRLEAPSLTADAALGEHLAALARASTPSAVSRVRGSGWKVPLAAVATIAASSSVAYAGEAAVSGHTRHAAPSRPMNTAPQPSDTATPTSAAAPAATPAATTVPQHEETTAHRHGRHHKAEKTAMRPAKGEMRPAKAEMVTHHARIARTESARKMDPAKATGGHRPVGSAGDSSP